MKLPSTGQPVAFPYHIHSEVLTHLPLSLVSKQILKQDCMISQTDSFDRKAPTGVRSRVLKTLRRNIQMFTLGSIKHDEKGAQKGSARSTEATDSSMGRIFTWTQKLLGITMTDHTFHPHNISITTKTQKGRCWMEKGLIFCWKSIR